MLFGPARSASKATRSASQFLQRDFVRRFRGWREASGADLRREPLSFSDQVIDGGVRLDFRRSVATPAVSSTTARSRCACAATGRVDVARRRLSFEGKQEGALYELLVLEMQKGALAATASCCPASTLGIERRVQLVDSACRYDRAGHERFQKGQ